MASRVICSAASLPWLMGQFLLYNDFLCIVNADAHTFCIQFNLLAQPEIVPQGLDVGGVRGNLLG